MTTMLLVDVCGVCGVWEDGCCVWSKSGLTDWLMFDDPTDFPVCG